MKEIIQNRLLESLKTLGFKGPDPMLDYPENPEHGDYYTNIALICAKGASLEPKALAQKIATEFENTMPEIIESVSVAGPGFINFKIKDGAIIRGVVDVVNLGKHYGRGTLDKGKEVMIEYTDPNPFKAMHIGHLMSNAIGESISRLFEYSGAKVIRANWQGDVGPHVAKALWGATNKIQGEPSGAEYWGKAYVAGNEAYDNDEKAKKEIDDINRKVYERSDPVINALYDKGRSQCLEAFELVYKKLGTKFDEYFFEGKEGLTGMPLVKEFLDKGVFEKSQGAVIFNGEKYGLHTRVFTTSTGLPTYETKELGLNLEKFKKYPSLSESLIVTGNEQKDYFKVLLKVMEIVYPEIAKKTKHIPHGMLRFVSGKMSSRKGNVISAESLIKEIRNLVKAKMIEHKLSAEEVDLISDQVAIAAIKYTILRSSIGGDIIFDSAASISFEGDSGPYMQYSAVRANSVLEKAKNIKDSPLILPQRAHALERLIVRFPNIVERARLTLSPQMVASYLISLAATFNNFYTNQVIVDDNDTLSPYYVALTQAFVTTMTNGLWTLGISVPDRM
jgi:arginyl-tRNA synthetase